MINSKLIRKLKLIILINFFILTIPALSQNEYKDSKFQFLSFEKIPTWTGLATNWEKAQAEIHLYDFNQYKGHAEYISKALKTGISFKQFKLLVKSPDKRKYLPFFLFDLRETFVDVNGKKYGWAVRLEDYEYDDNQQQMASTVLRLLDLVSGYIAKQTGNSSRGIIILATDSKAMPNTSIAEILNMKGYPNMTLTQLIVKVGGKKVEVLNQGIGIGYLRYVAAGKESSFRSSYKDILIYEKLPTRVRPVSGIITLEPQTPLSHINLLAKNRGTINLYTLDLKNILGAEKLIDKLVKLECSNEKISISEINLNEAEKIWAKRVKAIEIPQPLTNIVKIIDLNKNNPEIQTVKNIGAKAANYAIIRQLFPNYVRPGFAVPFSYYFNTIKSCGADTLIHTLVKTKPLKNELDKQLEKIRETILNAKLDPSLNNEINNLVKKQFNDSSIRLRSSTNCEDLPEFNGAGLYVSKGYKLADSDKKLAKKILQVYASLWTPLAYEEREYYQIDHSKTGMALLINQAFPNEYANGVAISIIDKNNISVFINSQFGENSVTNPENGQIPEAILFKSLQQNDYEIQTKSNIHDVFLQDSLKIKLFELRKLVMEVHHAYIDKLDKDKNLNYGIDIEFKIERESEEFKLYIKQARLLKSVLPE
jgi:hypothetical protein